MADKHEIKSLDIFLNEVLIGFITRLPGDRYTFQLAESYVEMNPRPMLSLSLKTVAGGLTTAPQQSRLKLPPFFSNLLPEGSLRDYLSGKLGIDPDREFFLLAHLGGDLPGAVVVKPSMSEQINMLGDKEPVSIDGTISSEQLKFSLAGVQLKFSALRDASGGLTIPAYGQGGSWIVKLPALRYPHVPENEYAMLQMAKAVGIDVPRVQLVLTKDIGNLPKDIPENFGYSLAVERFDRAAGGKHIHIEDFAQVYGVRPNEKYKRVSYTNMAHLIWNEMGEAGLREFIRRLVFSAAIGNADMHVKNWSIIYRDTIKPQLAPAYDFVSTIIYLPDAQMALSVAGIKAMYEFNVDLLKRMAAKAIVPERLVTNEAQEIAQKIKSFWHAERNNLALSTKTIKLIDTHMSQVPLLFSQSETKPKKK